MNIESTLQAEENAAHDLDPAAIGQNSTPRAKGVEGWIAERLNVLAFVVVAIGFVLRFLVATRSYLNPDEALHYVLLNQPSAFLAYKASLTNAHPPLIYLVVYFWHFLGRSEWMLRLPSVVAGTAFCWMFYKWMGLAFGRAASWIGLILATFPPAMIQLSAELRAYALLLFCLSSALYCLERAIVNKSVRLMWGFSAFLYLAILSHYSAVFFAIAAGVYVLARIADDQLPRKVMTAWAIGQAGALGIYAFLYITHISKLKDSIVVWSAPFEGLFSSGYDKPVRVYVEKYLRCLLVPFQPAVCGHCDAVVFCSGRRVFLWPEIAVKQRWFTNKSFGNSPVVSFHWRLVRCYRWNLSVYWQPPHRISGAF